MDNDKTIMALLGVIIIMLLIGILIFTPIFSKEDCRIEISSMDSLNVGDQFTIHLSDSNGNPISNAGIAFTFKDSNGAVTTKQATTDASGNAQVGLGDLSAGGYSVNCSVLENNKYKESSASKQISINQVQTPSQTSQSNGLSEDGYSYYPQYGPAVDTRGVTREHAIANNMHYIPMTIDGQNVGTYVPYDAKAGCYHT